MPVAFIGLAQTCAPIVAAEILAGVVSIESRFEPFAVRINNGPALTRRTATKAEAIEIATSLAAERQDIQLGLGGIGIEELRKLNLSISEAFDPCLNLQATATLLDGYYRIAAKAGANKEQAEQAMLQSYYGRNDPSVGAMVKYNEQVRQEVKRLGEILATLTIGGVGQGRGRSEAMAVDAAAEDFRDDLRTDRPALSWDVFNSPRRSSVLMFSERSNGAK
ncbi:type IV secretion system protein VirB1 [Mesorhizobium sp. DCY119]|nr:transglycosylase SLT domain-containing protein [Mesorhizobium sp. DCY119]RJG40929.1 type IV secretion system protein VirB1 [Mesorhizobium sp. DCY119]